MARLSFSQRFSALIQSHPDIPESAKRELINGIVDMRRRTPTERADGEWGDLIAAVTRARTSVTSNKPRWHASLCALMQEYADILTRVINLMRTQSIAYPTVAACAAATKAKNEKRVNMRELPLGERDHHWQSWVPPHIVQDLSLRVAQAYAERYRSGASTRGKRFYPFQPTYERVTLEKQIARARKAIDNLRYQARDDDGVSDKHRSGPGYATGSTPYRALILCACSQATRELKRIENDVDRGITPVYAATIPVNWQALLDPALRTRLRDASKNPNLVDTEGLDSFYVPSPVYTLEQGNEFAPPIPDDNDTQEEDTTTAD